MKKGTGTGTGKTEARGMDSEREGNFYGRSL